MARCFFFFNGMEVKTNKEQKEEPVTTRNHKLWIGGYIVLALASFTVYFLLHLHFFGLLGSYRAMLQKLTLAAGISFLVLMIERFAEKIISNQSHERAMRYNLLRLARLVSVLIIIFIFITFLFQNWYTAAVSLGLISLILGFALQTPISSFIGWVYILFRSPYHIGDRIQIDEFTGDVVEINYLDTTLWEFGGDYLTNDVPSGRLIRFPNSLVFQSAVYNYSWSKFPYIWNEIPFHIAYESDMTFVETVLKESAKLELGPDIAARIDDLKALVKQTPVDELEIKDYPFVSFRTNANTWLEATVTYLVPPKKASGIRSRIIKRAVAELLKEPDRVMFPKGNSR